MEKNFLALENTADESLLELYMTFKLADKNYAIKAEKINEIVQLPNLSLLEKLPDNIIGLMNLKGRIISVIDVRSFLGLEVTPYTTDNQVLIINTEDKTIGIIVDSVNDVVQFDQKDLEKLPYSSHGNYIYGAYNHQDSLVAFLNIQALSNSIKKLEIEEHQLNTPAKNASSQS